MPGKRKRGPVAADTKSEEHDRSPTPTASAPKKRRQSIQYDPVSQVERKICFCSAYIEFRAIVYSQYSLCEIFSTDAGQLSDRLIFCRTDKYLQD